MSTPLLTTFGNTIISTSSLTITASLLSSPFPLTATNVPSSPSSTTSSSSRSDGINSSPASSPLDSSDSSVAIASSSSEPSINVLLTSGSLPLDGLPSISPAPTTSSTLSSPSSPTQAAPDTQGASKDNTRIIVGVVLGCLLLLLLVVIALVWFLKIRKRGVGDITSFDKELTVLS
ncbi:unnamed protein product [Porites lobata]|uniref:Mid2 domain-containing protein n=1 Tax=Porites lobata TaxID=104759 RepID=A0ABN8R3N2_9CNID|nr:unnamed protein product [Porites lobata]